MPVLSDVFFKKLGLELEVGRKNLGVLKSNTDWSVPPEEGTLRWPRPPFVYVPISCLRRPPKRRSLGLMVSERCVV